VECEELVLEVLRTGNLAQGPMVARLEAEFAERCGTTHAVAVNSGTTALVASLQALGIGPGDEVVTSPFTFVATVNAILETGASVVFADVDRDDALMTASSAADACSARTRALMPVHLYGQMVNMSAFIALAEKQSLRIVEDAAQAVGAIRGGVRAGAHDVGCFSMYATKNLTTAEGGMITTNDVELADRLRALRNQGMRARYEYVLAGHNYRMTDVHAAIGLGQIGHLGEWTARRVENAARLREGLSGVPGLKLLNVHKDARHVYHQFTVRVTAESSIPRDDLVKRLAARDVGIGVYYPKVIYEYDSYRDNDRVSAQPCPNAELLASEVVSLPVHPHLLASDVDHVVDAVRQALHA